MAEEAYPDKKEYLENPSKIPHVSESGRISESDLSELEYGEVLVRVPRPNLISGAMHDVRVVKRGVAKIEDCENDEDRETFEAVRFGDQVGSFIVRHSGGRSQFAGSSADYRYYRTGLNALDYDVDEWIDVMDEIMLLSFDSQQAESFRYGLEGR
jgi:hypothetical protein